MDDRRRATEVRLGGIRAGPQPGSAYRTIATGLDPGALRIRSWVDGELRQDGTTADLILDIPTVFAEITRTTTVLTGTPAGVGRMRPGQRVRVEVEGVGVPENPMVARAAPGQAGRA